MKKILLAFTALIFTAAAAHAASYDEWSYKGQMKWYDLDGTAVQVSYAETRVSDDYLRVLYAPQFKRWYIEFLYKDSRQFVDRQPEFFVRTKEVQGSGRYSSDYLISTEAIIRNGSPAYIIMELNRDDLAALKTELDMGVGYYTSNRVEAIEGQPQEIGEYRTYGFTGSGASAAITAIENANGLNSVSANNAEDRKAHQEQIRQNEKTAQLLQWYEGNYAEAYADGTLRWGGCDSTRKIDYDRFPNLVQRGKFLVRFNGILAISASGGTKPDEIYISTAYNQIKGNILAPTYTDADTRRIPLFVEEGPQYMRLRLGVEIPGISYKRIIDYENDMLKLVAYDTRGESIAPLYFKRCEK